MGTTGEALNRGVFSEELPEKSFCNILFFNEEEELDFAVNKDEICFFFINSVVFRYSFRVFDLAAESSRVFKRLPLNLSVARSTEGTFFEFDELKVVSFCCFFCF